MRARRTLVAALVVLAAGLVAPGSGSGAVTVTEDRTEVQTQLGREFGFQTTITNDGGGSTGPLIAHLNVLSLRDGTYVDPEDWSTSRTKYLGSLEAGASETVDWRVKAVNDGAFAVYVAVLRQDDPTRVPDVGNGIEVAVAKRTTINSGGIVPLALGVPIALGVLAAVARVRRRR